MASQQDVVKMYSCPVCLEILDRPVKMSCNHRMCQVCFDEYVEDGEELCPICRQPLGQPQVDEEALDRIKTTETSCQDCGHKMTLAALTTHITSCPRKKETLPKFQPVAESMQAIAKDVPNRATFACPYCPEKNLSVEGLLEHCNQLHQDAPQRVVCPVCASMPWGDPNQKSGNFLSHLNMRHKFEYDTYVMYDADEEKMLQAALEASLNA